jgi:hypothetical protein
VDAGGGVEQLVLLVKIHRGFDARAPARCLVGGGCWRSGDGREMQVRGGAAAAGDFFCR